MKQTPTATRRMERAIPLGLAVLVFLLMQWLSSVHLHVHGHEGRPREQADLAPTPPASALQADRGWLRQLAAAHDEGSVQCHALDALQVNGAVPASPPALLVQPTEAAPPSSMAWGCSSLSGVHFQARAPPLVQLDHRLST